MANFYLVDNNGKLIAKGTNFDKLQNKADAEMNGYVMNERDYLSIQNLEHSNEIKVTTFKNNNVTYDSTQWTPEIAEAMRYI